MPETETPLLIYDGRCGFCKIWIEYWKKLTGDALRYEATDEAGPSVRLVLTGGETLTGARAVFTALQDVEGRRWLIGACDNVPGFAAVAELAYRLIAAHRNAAYRATVLLFGRQVNPPRYERVSWLFQKLLAIIYVIAFWTFAVQARGLIGSQGIVPLARYLAAFHAQFGSASAWMALTVWN